jgi:hypothetical protein
MWTPYSFAKNKTKPKQTDLKSCGNIDKQIQKREVRVNKLIVIWKERNGQMKQTQNTNELQYVCWFCVVIWIYKSELGSLESWEHGEVNVLFEFWKSVGKFGVTCKFNVRRIQKVSWFCVVIWMCKSDFGVVGKLRAGENLFVPLNFKNAI